MKSTDNQGDVVRMPQDLLARAQAVADEEQRTTDELVREAVQRYLDDHPGLHPNRHQGNPPGKSLAQLLMESPFAGSELNLERRKDYARPPEL